MQRMCRALTTGTKADSRSATLVNIAWIHRVSVRVTPVPSTVNVKFKTVNASPGRPGGGRPGHLGFKRY